MCACAHRQEEEVSFLFLHLSPLRQGLSLDIKLTSCPWLSPLRLVDKSLRCRGDHVASVPSYPLGHLLGPNFGFLTLFSIIHNVLFLSSSRLSFSLRLDFIGAVILRRPLRSPIVIFSAFLICMCKGYEIPLSTVDHISQCTYVSHLVNICRCSLCFWGSSTAR